MMTHQAGVRTVVMGGRPTGPSPMQAASGVSGILHQSWCITDQIYRIVVQAYTMQIP